MPLLDSLDKVIGVYFAATCCRPFNYKGRRYLPKELIVSPMIFRGFTCPPGCGGCCPRFSLDYLPDEVHPYGLKERLVGIDDREVLIYSDMQDYHQNHHCRNLDMTTGRCGIHGRQPFSCDFELIRFIVSRDSSRQTQQLFGRGWNMLRVDGERGALCEMLKPDLSSISEVLRKLHRLLRWSSYFGIETRTPEVIEWASSGPHSQPLRLQPPML